MKKRLNKANADHRHRFKVRYGSDADLGDATNDDYIIGFMRSGGHCEFCANKLQLLTFHVDLVMPLVLGGRHTLENLAIACPKCNLSKGSQHPARFVSKLVAKGIVTKRNLRILEKYDIEPRVQLSLFSDIRVEPKKAA